MVNHLHFTQYRIRPRWRQLALRSDSVRGIALIVDLRVDLIRFRICQERVDNDDTDQ